MHRSRWMATLALSLVAGQLWQVSAPSSAAQQRDSWGAPVPLVEQQGGIASLACPAVSHCYAIDDAGDVESWNGSQWTAPVRLVDPREESLVSISCPSPGSCIVLTNGGSAFVLRRSKWFGPTVVDPTLSNASCPSTTFCLGTTPSGLVAVRWNGKRWGTPQLEMAGNSINFQVSCTSTTSCVALHEANDGIESFRFDGSSWTRLANAYGSEYVLGETLTCSGPSLCLMFYQADSAPQAISVFNGTSWNASGSFSFGSGGQFIADLACGVASSCLLLQTDGTASEFSGTSWKSLGSFTPDTVSTAHGPVYDSVGTCVATDCGLVAQTADGYTYSTWSSGANWSSPSAANPVSGGLSSIDCTSRQFCVGLEPLGATVLDRSGRWSPGTSASPGPLNWLFADALSCADQDLCVVPSMNPGGLEGVSVWNGRRWRPTGLSDVDELLVSCDAGGFCMALLTHDGRNSTFTVTRGGSFAPTRSTPLASGEGWQTLSCAGSNFCTATDGSTYSVFNGSTWTPQRPLPAGIRQVLCGSANFCLGYSSGTSSAKFAVFTGTGWSATRSLPESLPSGLGSCVVNFCTLASATGMAIEYTNGSWSSISTIDPIVSTSERLESVSCWAPWQCLAADSAGFVVRLG